MPKLAQPAFLPMTAEECRRLGWRELDVLLVTGDAYVDHPAFGTALIGRALVQAGFRTGIVAQPRPDHPEDITVMGTPRLCAGVSAGALDSMLAHYTSFRKKRSDDAYTPGGRAGARPNRAVIAYTNLCRRAFGDLPVLLGGIEASLRRLAHYDFWTEAIRRSLLLDAKADLILYGMAESSVVAAVKRLEGADAPRGKAARAVLAGLPGSVFYGPPPDDAPGERLLLPSLDAIKADTKLLLPTAQASEEQVHRGDDDPLWLSQQNATALITVAPPAPLSTTAELDAIHAWPFARAAHPSYTRPIPAVGMLAGSLCAHRGCGGGCSFCSLAAHQGRRLVSRSRASIVAEAKKVAKLAGVQGQITDVGGPTANMWGAVCTSSTTCRRSSCLWPKLCPHFKADQAAYVELLDAVAALPEVRGVRVASGLRHDLGLTDPKALSAIIMKYTGGQFKAAPEHTQPDVLALMRKPSIETFERFLEFFGKQCQQAGSELYVVPYLMSAFPGATAQSAARMKEWLAARGWSPKQVQCFIPTPGTVATAMYVAGIDEQGRPIAVDRDDASRMRQHAALVGQWGQREDDTVRRGPAPRRPSGPSGGGPSLADRRGKALGKGSSRAKSGRGETR